jgi:hypothetical protein
MNPGRKERWIFQPNLAKKLRNTDPTLTGQAFSQGEEVWMS